MIEATLSETIPRVDEYPTVMEHAARQQAASDALAAAQRELARVILDQAEAQRRYRALSDAVVRGELTEEAPEWQRAKEELKALDQQSSELTFRVHKLQQGVEDCRAAGTAIRNEATRERALQVAQGAKTVATEMVRLLQQVLARNHELMAYKKLLGSSGRPVPIDPRLLQGFINQLGG